MPPKPSSKESRKSPSLFPVEPAGDDCLVSSKVALAEPAWPDRFGEFLRRYAVTHLRPIRTLSLFSGGGGLDLGFHDAGFDVREAVEVETRCIEALRANSAPGGLLTGLQPRHLDVRHFTPDPSAGYEFVIGGPPCQSFSAAGRRAEGVAGINDDRGTLFHEFVRILRVVRPRGFLFENVYGITGANGGEAWREIRTAFTAAGYEVWHRILDAADYGVPQHRERAIIVGVREGEFRFPRPTHGPDAPSGRGHYAAGVAISGAGSEPGAPTSVNGRYGHLLTKIPPGLNYSFFTERMGHPQPVFAWRSKFSDFLYKADPNEPVRTVKAQGGQYTGPFHWENRPFSVAEFKRLQTFPDGYMLPMARQGGIKLLGNSVPPQFARVLALAVREQLFGEVLPWGNDYLFDSDVLSFRTQKRSRTVVYQSRATESIRKAIHFPTVSRVRKARHFRVELSTGFAIQETDSGAFSVEIKTTKKVWSIGVGNRKAVGRIVLRPNGVSGWVLPVSQVELFFDPGAEKSFTVAWKVFEAEVIAGGYKADLVQLSGYYQYQPSISAKVTYTTPVSTEWQVIAAICDGTGVAKTHSVNELAKLWCVPVVEVHRVSRWLRSLGYEVRNSNTNGEVPEGCYLIPYAFPTLSPLSVQLRKSLA